MSLTSKESALRYTATNSGKKGSGQQETQICFLFEVLSLD